MTTFKRGGCSLRKAVSFMVLALICGCGSNGGGTHTANQGWPALPTCGKQVLDPGFSNRYVLLLFFKRDQQYHDGIWSAFNKTDAKLPGCIPDPDSPDASKPMGIIAQGSCPTDCAHPKLYEMTGDSSDATGDPLSRIHNSPAYPLIMPGQTAVWAIFAADSTGQEFNPDDQKTEFGVWQIVVKDSCHAGEILKLLQDHWSTVFSDAGGFLGQITIGYTPQSVNLGSKHGKGCTPVDPKGSQ
jgi:hypothetical protein